MADLITHTRNSNFEYIGKDIILLNIKSCKTRYQNRNYNIGEAIPSTESAIAVLPFEGEIGNLDNRYLIKEHFEKMQKRRGY